jgi:signal transduction histidine kinase
LTSAAIGLDHGRGKPMRPGVRHKLTLLGTVSVLVVSSGFLALNLWLTRRWLEEDLQGRVVSFARVMAATISSREEFESGAVLADQVRGIRTAREDLLQLDVLAFQRDRTEVVATTTPDRRLPFTRKEIVEVMQGRVVSRPEDGPAGPHWDVLAPIYLDGVVAGAVGARFSSVTADRLTERMRTGGVLLTGASVAVTALLMTLAVHYVVDRPVRGFLGAIDRIQRGDQGATVALGTRDEFGVLAAHFNDMVARVRGLNAELQERVEAATGELDRRYREVQQLNALLFDLQRRLSHAERLAVAGRIMAEVAHEVGTPLHSVAGHLELLRKDLPGGVLRDVGDRLAIIDAEVARVIAIIARLLELTRRPRGDPRPVDLNQLVREMRDLVGPGVAAAGLTLEVRTADRLPLIQGHADPLREVILNLLTNAIAATPRGGRVTVATRAAEDERDVELSVSDTGHGIPATDHVHIFEPFFSTKPAGRGTGLGLFITAQIVRDHRGRIEVDSAEGRGSVFRVRLSVAAGA